MAQKVYQIQINGLTESINAVDALNKQLDALDKKISALQGKAVNVGVKSSSGGGSKSLSEEEKIEQQIAKIDEKRVAYSKEIYQNYLAAKDVLKETENDQKSIAASERLQAKTYSNTIAGMKQELADIKSAMQTVDLGDTDQMDKMVQRANELNNSLKKIEESYGQFGRNVGNYANGVAEGLQKVKIEVGGTVREFDNAKQAAKTLGNELKTMAVNGQTDTKEFKELRQTVLELESTMNDAKKPMDGLMDTMESFVAIASAYKGIGAFFGVDENKIQKSIQQLLALQTALKGIQTISKQIQTREGVGGWIAKASSSMDAFASSITKTEKAANKLSLALKTLTGLALVAVIYQIVKALSDLKKKEDEVSKATEEGVKAYAKAEIEISTLKTKLDNFNGSKKQEEKLVNELNSKYGSALGQYKSLAAWKDALIKKGRVYCQVLQKEAEIQALMNIYTENFIKLQKAKQAQDEGSRDTVDLILKALDGEAKISQVLASIRDDLKAPFSDNLTEYNDELEREISEMEGNNEKILEQIRNLQTDIDELNKENKLFDYSDQIDKNTKKTKDSMENAQNTLNQLEIRLMQDGLNKKLKQLEEEKRQTINKLKQNAKTTSEDIQKVETAYNKIRLKTINDYLKELENSVKATAKEISQTTFELNTKDLELQIKDINQEIDGISKIVPKNFTLTTSAEYSPKIKGVPENAYINAAEYNALLENKDKSEEALNEFYSFLDDYNKKIGGQFDVVVKDAETGVDKILTDYESFENYLEGIFAKELYSIREYGVKYNTELGVIDTSLNNSFEFRLNAQKAFNEDYISYIIDLIDEEEKLRKEEAISSFNNLQTKNENEYNERRKALEKTKKELEAGIDALIEIQFKENRVLTAEEEKTLNVLKENLETTNYQINQLEENFSTHFIQILNEHRQEIIDIENEMNEKRQSNQEKYFDNQISNYRDFLSKINQEAQKQPVTNAFGIVDIAKTKENYREILDASETTLKGILKDKENLNKAFKNGLISSSNYNAILNQLNDLETDVNETSKEITDRNKQTFSDFVASLQMYIQEVMNSFNTIMNAVWDAQDVAFEKEQDEIDKWNDELDKALDKQQEIIEEHKDKIDSIEDELANSRGDRRQHLIDQLNAEIEAQRRAEKEEERIQKEKEAMQKKQDALELKRKKAQYKRDLLQAIVNGAMAVTMAAINTWPIPAIPMMALAGSTTAAQIAIMAANKPYASGGQLDGGQIVGNRHRDGGVKVLGGRAEVEGGEYITNRLTTSKNLDLLEFVNSKKKRIDISDMLEFYNGGRVKTTIQRVRSKFEDGGYIAPLPDALDIKEQLQNIIINQDNRPIYVSVVDINNKQDDVRRVQTLAGL